jgi:threonine synthase
MTATFVSGRTCVVCGVTHEEGTVDYTCPRCGVSGILDVVYDYEAANLSRPVLSGRRERSIWRYREVLPIDRSAVLPQILVGSSPLYRFDDLGSSLGLSTLYVKDDGRLPSGSFKDRASAVGAVIARHRGFRKVTCASTGNAASSFACFAAHLGLDAYIFVPAAAPPAKVAQLQAFGATPLLVEGTYDQAYDLCMEAAPAFGWYNRNCAINSSLVEGKKTCGLEIAEQVAGIGPAKGPGGPFPDWVSVSVGDGCTVAGIWKGMVEMRRFGVIDRLPRLLATQAAGAAPIAQAWQEGSSEVSSSAASSAATGAGTIAATGAGTGTRADSISVSRPRNAVKALRAVRDSGGAFVVVEDDAILGWIRRLGAATGVFGEPAGVAGLAGIEVARESGVIRAGESVLHVVTGTGLKDVAAVSDAVPAPARVEPSLDSVARALDL